jgi:hypothetical protein
VPTHITKLNNKYFIVDCNHHRVIWSDNINSEVKDWNTVDVEFAGPHSIASDGDIYVIENTGYNEVIVLDSNLKFKQRLYNVGGRPHKTIYDLQTDAFYVVSAPYIFCYRKLAGQLTLIYQKSPSFLAGTYVRSFKIIDSKMYFVSGNGHINVVNYIDESYTVMNAYPVPSNMSFMDDIEKVGDYFYLTAMQGADQIIAPTAVRIKDLNRLQYGEYEDIYSKLGFTTTPYFIEVFDNRVFITEIGEISRIISFAVSDVELSEYITHFSFTGGTSDDIKRSDMYPR